MANILSVLAEEHLLKAKKRKKYDFGIKLHKPFCTNAPKCMNDVCTRFPFIL